MTISRDMQIDTIANHLLTPSLRPSQLVRLQAVANNWLQALSLMATQLPIDGEVFNEWYGRFDVYPQISEDLVRFDTGDMTARAMRHWLVDRLAAFLKAAEDFSDFRQSVSEFHALMTKFSQQR